MNRKVNLVSHESQNIKELENIPINNMDSVFSFSCEILVCKNFSIFEEPSSRQALSVLLDKVRPQGQLILGVSNLKSICSDYLNRKIDNETFLKYIRNVRNHIGMDDIIAILESTKNGILVDIKSDNYVDYLTIIKTKP